MHIGSTQTVGGALLTGHRADDVWTGNEDLGIRAHDDDVGQCRAVCRATCGGTQHQGQLRNPSGCPDGGREDASDTVEGRNALPEPSTAGMPDSHHRGVEAHRGLDGVDDPSAAVTAHRPALDGCVRSKCDDRVPVDGALSSQHPGVVRCGEGFK